MSLTAPERETVIVWSDADDKISITTCQKKMITSLRNNPQFEETEFTSGILFGYLPLGGITVRRARRAGRKTLPTNAQRCGKMKANGQPCQALANADTGTCGRHKNS